ncbi:MAG TPA: amidohydrolase family protein [Allosphingosinicella sp.]|nr:amidohydrolase family protein [Allosphingosinicella sp.]
MIEGQQASLLIRGDAVTPDGIARDRYIVVRDGRIAEISRRRPARTEGLKLLETRRGDLIFPGLINLHTHSTYNPLPLWRSPDAPFDNRHEWRNNAGYKKAVSGVSRSLSALPGMERTISVFGELQAVAGGTAVLQEDKDLESERSLGGLLLCRDTASADDLGLPAESAIMSVVDFFKPRDRTSGPPEPQRSIAAYAARRAAGTLAATIVHLAEGRSGFGSDRGVDAYSRAEFEAFMALPEMADAAAVRQSPLALVHGCGIDPRDPRHLDFLLERDISIVWSPVSNLLLYGDTIDVESLIGAGINVALGSDWAPSGSKHVWDEAKFARAYFDALGAPVPTELIFRMVTANAARCLGAPHLGRIAEGGLADFFILRSPVETDHAYEVFLGTEDRHVLATIIGGRPIYGERAFLEAFTGDLQPLPSAEGSAARDKAVHLPPELGFDVEAEVARMEAELKKLDPPVWRSNLLVSSDKLYRRRIKELRSEVQNFGWGAQVWRHDGASPTAGLLPVPPESVRVWWGYRRPDLSYADFQRQLGSVFMPCAVAVQAPLGLTAYLPALLPEAKPEAVPDEIALVFFESQDVYRAMFKTAGGRAYGLLHGMVFDGERSKSDFPSPFAGSLEPGRPAHLLDSPADWQNGTTQVFVGARSAGLDPEAFLAALAAAAASLKADPPAGLDGAIVSAAPDYVLWWQHWTGEPGQGQGPADRLAGIAEAQMDRTASRAKAPPTIFWRSPGLEINPGDALNLRFQRRGSTPW